jgi:hypothetical protein
MRAKPTSGIVGCSNPIENSSSARPYEASQPIPQLCCQYGNVSVAATVGVRRGRARCQEPGLRSSCARVPRPGRGQRCRGDGAAPSVIDVAGRQHRALAECLGLRHAPVLISDPNATTLSRSWPGSTRGPSAHGLDPWAPTDFGRRLPATMDTRHKAGHGRLRVVRVRYLIGSDDQISASQRPTSLKVPPHGLRAESPSVC